MTSFLALSYQTVQIVDNRARDPVKGELSVHMSELEVLLTTNIDLTKDSDQLKTIIKVPKDVVETGHLVRNHFSIFIHRQAAAEPDPEQFNWTPSDGIDLLLQVLSHNPTDDLSVLTLTHIADSYYFAIEPTVSTSEASETMPVTSSVHAGIAVRNPISKGRTRNSSNLHISCSEASTYIIGDNEQPPNLPNAFY